MYNHKLNIHLYLSNILNNFKLFQINIDYYSNKIYYHILNIFMYLYRIMSNLRVNKISKFSLIHELYCKVYNYLNLNDNYYNYL